MALNKATIKTMTTGSRPEKSYAMGFFVNQYNNWWHTGSLPGTSSEIGRESGGFCWAILINYRPEVALRGDFTKDLDELFWKVKDSVAFWPKGTKL
jgi:hypothetical protein